MKKINCFMLCVLCSIIFCTALNAQDSLNRSGYDKVPPPASQPTNQYGKAPPMANPKQLNKTTAAKDLNTQVQQKATNQYGPPPVSGKAASNPYGTLPKKPANAPDNQIGGNQQDGYDDVPPPPNAQATNQYGKAPPMANPKQLNRTTAGKDLNTQVQQKATNQYGPPPVSGKAASNPYGTLPKKPANAPDNQIDGNQQNGYDDVPPPPASQATNQYGKAPPMANPKQLNRTTATKDLNTPVQQKATNQYGPPPVSGKAASNQYGTLPKKPAGAADNQIGNNQQDGYDDVPPPPNSQATNNYGKAPPMANPKQLNRTTATKDLNTQVQQKTTNQNVQQPAANAAATNPKSQYGPLPPPGRTQQYGTVPATNSTVKPGSSASGTNPKSQYGPLPPPGRTQQYGTVPATNSTAKPASSASGTSAKQPAASSAAPAKKG